MQGVCRVSDIIGSDSNRKGMVRAERIAVDVIGAGRETTKEVKGAKEDSVEKKSVDQEDNKQLGTEQDNMLVEHEVIEK